jgi:hypothetical protein
VSDERGATDLAIHGDPILTLRTDRGRDRLQPLEDPGARMSRTGQRRAPLGRHRSAFPSRRGRLSLNFIRQPALFMLPVPAAEGFMNHVG